MENLRDLVLNIHATPHKAVLAITGGGAEAIGELLRHGQGSNTLLEAVVPYDQNAFDRFVRGKPDKYCSRGAANDLAMAAYQRGLSLIEPPLPVAHTSNPEFEKLKSDKTMEALRDRTIKVDLPPPVIGVGVTCSLAKDNERVGRQHHAYVALQDDDSTYTFEVQLDDQQRTRNEQEALVARAVIQALATHCGVKTPIVNCINGESIGLSTEYIEVVKGQRDVAPSFYDRRNRVIFPGAFNPFHDQHERIAEVVSQITGYRVDLEVCIRNVDKPALSYATIMDRRDRLLGVMDKKQWAGKLIFTSTPTFAEKAAAFPESTFVVGWDTYARICDPKYGSVEEAVNLFKRHKVKFIVFDRIVGGMSCRQIYYTRIHPELLAISNVLDHEVLPPVEMASSSIRKGQ